jgi:hypothetical protein
MYVKNWLSYCYKYIKCMISYLIFKYTAMLKRYPAYLDLINIIIIHCCRNTFGLLNIPMKTYLCLTP